MLIALAIILAITIVAMYFDKQHSLKKQAIADVLAEAELFKTTSELMHIREALIAAIIPDDPKYCFNRESILGLVERRCHIIKTQLKGLYQELETDCRDLRRQCTDLKQQCADQQASKRALRSRILEVLGEEPERGSIPKHRATNEGEHAGMGKSLLNSIPEAGGARGHILPDGQPVRDDDTTPPPSPSP